MLSKLKRTLNQMKYKSKRSPGEIPVSSPVPLKEEAMHELRLVVIVTVGAVMGAIGIDILLMLLRAVFY